MLTAALVPLAESETGKAAPLGLLVILVLCLAVFLLGRSMATHLKRVPHSFDEPPGDDLPPGTPGEGPPNGPA